MRTRRLREAAVARSAFAGFRFPPDVIVLAVRWYRSPPKVRSARQCRLATDQRLTKRVGQLGFAYGLRRGRSSAP